MSYRLPELCRVGMRVGLAALLLGRLLTPTEGAPLGQTLAWPLLALATLSLAGLALATGACRWPRFAGVDFGWIALTLAPLACAVIHRGQGDDRAAINLGCEWVGLLATWGSLRILQSEPGAEMGWHRLVASAALGLSLLGLWQHYAGYASDRSEYLRLVHRQAELQADLGGPRQSRHQELARELAEIETTLFQLGVPEEGPGRKLWEARLLSSSEPVGLFALANTLAGLLLVGVLLWGLWSLPENRLAHGTSDSSMVQSPGRWAMSGVALGVVGFCLLLTKSRTAWGGTLAAAGLLALLRKVQLRAWLTGPHRVWLMAGAAATAALITLAWWSGGLDRLVLLEAFKSLRYRGEYWTGTWRMLWDPQHPVRWLVGVGPGNFRSSYLPFKLPESSEEIADPHNLFLDHWAAGGLVGLLAVVALWYLAVRTVLDQGLSAVTPSAAVVAPRASTPLQRVSSRPELVGALLALGVLLLFHAGSPAAWPLLVVMGGLLWGWWATGDRPLPQSAWRGAILLGLLIHLLAAGGIGMPAIVALLQILSLPRDTTGTMAEAEAGGVSGLIVAAISTLLFAGVITQGLQPVTTAELELALGDEALSRGATERGIKSYRAAAQADRLAPQPVERLAAVMQRDWLATGDDQAFQKCVQYRQQAVERNPLAVAGWRLLGETWRLRFEKTGQLEDARKGAENLQQAVSRHPTNAVLLVELARSQFDARDFPAARNAALRALELDAINHRLGHSDKYLSEAQLALLQRCQEAPADPPVSSEP